MKCPNCGNELKSSIRDYNYKQSGLPNAWLRGIKVYDCSKCGEELPELKNIHLVHDAIAGLLVKKRGSLTGNEIKFLRKIMGLKANELADNLGMNHVTISRWETGAEKIGPSSDKILRLHYLLHKQKSALAEASKEVYSRMFELARTIIAVQREAQAEEDSISIPPELYMKKREDEGLFA